MTKLKEICLKYKELILYVIFGAATTGVSWGTYALFVKGFSMGVSTGKVLSWVCAVLFAFITNKIWVFEKRSKEPKTVAKEFVTFFGSRLFTGVIENAGLPLLMKWGLDQPLFGVDGMLANIVISVIVVVLNYVFSKLLVFRKEKRNETE